MSSLFSISAAIILVVSALHLAPLAQADCCDAVVGYGLIGTGRCRDCFPSTPCCGLGACNILCCGCDGSCRQGDFPICTGLGMGYPYPGLAYDYGGGGYGGGWYKRSDNEGEAEVTDVDLPITEPRTARLIFTKLDTNNDGKVDKGEMDLYIAVMYRLPNQTLDDVDVHKLYSFADMDRDQDEYLSLEEIDS